MESKLAGNKSGFASPGNKIMRCGTTGAIDGRHALHRTSLRVEGVVLVDPFDGCPDSAPRTLTSRRVLKAKGRIGKAPVSGEALEMKIIERHDAPVRRERGRGAQPVWLVGKWNDQPAQLIGAAARFVDAAPVDRRAKAPNRERSS